MTTRSVLWAASPAIIGAGFIALVLVGHWLFRNSIVGVRALIALEFLYILVFLFSLIAAVASFVEAARKRQLVIVALAALGIALGIYFVGYGLHRGAAILYAT